MCARLKENIGFFGVVSEIWGINVYVFVQNRNEGISIECLAPEMVCLWC